MSTGPLRGRAAFGALCCLALLHAVLYPAFFTDSYATFSIVLYEVAAVFTIPLVFLRMRASTDQDRLGWTVMLAAVCTTGTLDTLWSVAERVTGGLGYPNWFDPFYICSYIAYIVAIGLLSSPLWRQRDYRWMFDAGALMAVAAGLLWHFVIPRTSDGDLLTSVLGVTYLTLDLCFLGTVLTAIYTARLTLRNGFLLLAAATFGTGDILYYFEAGAFDASWLVGMWLIALAAVTDPGLRIRLPHVKFARAGAVPYVFVGVIGAVTLVEMKRGVADDLLLAGIAALAMVVLRQIITLRQALASQKRETAFRQAVLETQSDLGLGMAILHGGRVIYANQAAERIVGLTFAELASLDSVAELRFGATDDPEWLLWLANPETTLDTIFTRNDGTVVDIEVVARWMQTSGEPQLLLVARDVTTRRQAEEALAQAQKLEGLGALAGGVAHDFNNLLSSVLGNVGLLRLGELDEEARETVGNIESAVRRGADLTRSLLDFARVQPAGFAVEDLRDCLKETASLARTALPVNVKLEVQAGVLPVRVRLNRGQVIQGIFNLILNARDAVGERGTIWLSLQYDDRVARVVVRDSGAGMDETTRQRIFEPFFTTKTAGAGTGLGLAITQRTMRDHRGSISVESAEGEGTTITLTLPLAAAALAS